MTSPTPTPPYLGEREAVAREPEVQKFEVTGDDGCIIHFAGSAWFCFEAEVTEYQEWASSEITRLRTENETLRAERNAAIARAEALAKVSLIQARELWRLDPNGATPADLNAAMADLGVALTTPEPPHGD